MRILMRISLASDTSGICGKLSNYLYAVVKRRNLVLVFIVDGASVACLGKRLLTRNFEASNVFGQMSQF